MPTIILDLSIRAIHSEADCVSHEILVLVELRTRRAFTPADFSCPSDSPALSDRRVKAINLAGTIAHSGQTCRSVISRDLPTRENHNQQVNGNVLSGAQFQVDRTFYVQDHLTNGRFLVDTGAQAFFLLVGQIKPRGSLFLPSFANFSFIPIYSSWTTTGFSVGVRTC